MMTIKGKCDICNKPDGHFGHNLQKCKDCKLLVHELCYCLEETSCKNPDFICHACQAVGAPIEVNVGRYSGGTPPQRKVLIQHKRPTECVLCSVNRGTHAMHPLFDTHGKNGRQRVLPQNGTLEERLAWVHTLCAQFICINPNTAGCVYGLTKDGKFEQDDSIDGSYRNSSDEDSNEDSSEEDNDDSANVHSWVFAEKENGEETPWTRCIDHHRKELKCFICGEDDKRRTSLRIPVQCVAGDKNELDEFKERHLSISAPCMVGMHVGCARWMANVEMVDGKRCQLCYFYPGKEQGDVSDPNESFRDPVANCYCSAHSREIIQNKPGAKPSSSRRKNGSKSRKMIPRKVLRAPPKRRFRTCRSRRLLSKGKHKKTNCNKNRMSESLPFGRKETSDTIEAVSNVQFTSKGKSSRALS